MVLLDEVCQPFTMSIAIYRVSPSTKVDASADFL